MKSFIRKILHNEISQNLNEGRALSPKNKFAKEWLSQYNNLKKYKSGDGRFIYLVDNKGIIMVSLDTQINETAVTWEIWSLLYKVFGEKESRRKIISWLLDVYKLSNMGYVYDETSDMMGKIDSSDILIEKGQLQESNNIDQLKRFFFNKWDQEKKQGKVPNIYDISKLGLASKKNEIIQFFMEYMGYDGNSRTEIITKYLMDNIFTEKEMIQVMGNFFDGKLTIKFDKVEFSEEDEENLLNVTKNYINLDANFIVLEGTFYDPESGQDINFSTGNNPFDDFVSYHEFKEGIIELVEYFVNKVIESFGFDIDKHFNYIDITEG
jgi:mRNA-degrading endonuclease RelE of RelBE toxin-antitoxin system